MLCSLLKAFEVFFVGNALFSSSATVHLTSNRSTVAVTYELEHHGIRLDHTVTVLEDYRYHACFPPTLGNHYVYVSDELRQKLRRIERLPVVYHNPRNGYHCVRRAPSGPKATDLPKATDPEKRIYSSVSKTPIPSVSPDHPPTSVVTNHSHRTPSPHSPATRPPLQKKNDTHSITTGLFLSNETLLPNTEKTHLVPANASIANASIANTSTVAETKGSLRSPLVSVFRLTQSSSSHPIDDRDASSHHPHRILLVENPAVQPVVNQEPLEKADEDEDEGHDHQEDDHEDEE